MKLGLYIHIPFCRSKCDYCSFYSIPLKDRERGEQASLVGRYAGQLLKEISRRAEGTAFEVDTVYFGGGTPSLLTGRQMGEILAGVRRCFHLADGRVEITLECNPEDAGPVRLEEFRDAGINRIVLGIQTMDRELHALIGRSARLCGENTLDQFFSIGGFTHAVDLIAGIPGQKEADLTQELNRICDYGPEHISAYMLSIEKGTPLLKRVNPPEGWDGEQRGLFGAAMELLKGRGYRHYEVSNFCLPGFESRHNMKYWNYQPYIGLGAGAHTFLKGKRYYHPPDLGAYMETADFLPERDERTPAAEMVEAVMTGMRLLDGFSWSDFEDMFSLPVPGAVRDRFERKTAEGYLTRVSAGDNVIYRLTEKGLFFLDGLVYDLVEPLL